MRVLRKTVASIFIALFFMVGFCYGQSSQEKTQSVTMEAGDVKATLQLTDFTLDSEGFIVARGRGAMLHADFLPVNINIDKWHSQCETVKSFVTQTVIWVEPTNNPEIIHIILDNAKISDDSLHELGLTRKQLPELKMFIQFRPLGSGGYGQAPILCDGVKIYGATKGPVKLKGRLYSNIKGAVIVDASLIGESTRKLKEAETLAQLKETEKIAEEAAYGNFDRCILSLESKDWAVRLKAAKTLGDIGDNRAIEPLIMALSDKDGRVRWRVSETLRKLTREDFGEDQAKWLVWWKNKRNKK